MLGVSWPRLFLYAEPSFLSAFRVLSLQSTQGSLPRLCRGRGGWRLLLQRRKHISPCDNAEQAEASAPSLGQWVLHGVALGAAGRAGAPHGCRGGPHCPQPPAGKWNGAGAATLLCILQPQLLVLPEPPGRCGRAMWVQDS